MSYTTLARKAVPTARAKAATTAAPGGLRIRDANDMYEQEADHVAEEVMTGRAARWHWSVPGLSIGSSLQRKCSCGGSGGADGECEECKKKEGASLQRKAAGPAGSRTAPPIVQDVLASPGRPLDPATRGVMEAHFGCDFSKVRVHTDTRASESAHAIDALAYTVGSDVVFGAGRYAPDTSRGKRLLAHELAHTIQQAPGIARQAGTIPAPPLDLSGPASKKARDYQPHFRPHIPKVPKIPAPPAVEENTPPPGPCPSAAEVIREIKQRDVASETETAMERDINLGKVRAGRARPVTQKLISEADAAIRKEFGDVLPSGRNFADPKSIDTHTPADFAKQRVPDAAAAGFFIGQAALETAGKFLRDLCVTAPDHAQLQSEVAAPILKRKKIDFVRDHQSSRIGGMTKFPEIKGTVTPHVDLPTTSANAGHIVVHEAMHFYVNDVYRRTAEASKLDKELMEGGAEYLARQVINRHLDGRPDFQIHYGTYASEFFYVTNYLLRGGLSTFKQAYFKGHTDLLGLTPVQPKLAISQPGDEFEREADRAAEAIVTGRAAHELTSLVGHPTLQRQPNPSTPNAAAQKRLDTFTIDAKDLSDPFVTGQLRSMSNSALVDYKNKVKDADVKRFVDSLLTFSTPLQAGARVEPLLSADMTMKIGNINVVIKPDIRGAAAKSAGTAGNVTVVPPTVPSYGYDKDEVVNDFAGYAPVVTLEIVTSYPTGMAPETTSGYGRGTTAQDISNKATGLRFHEGTHGEDMVDFVRQTPFPTFTGKVGMKKKDFETAKKTYTDAVSAWGKALDKVKLQGDCVGKTIDEFHKGEKGYKNICP